MIHSADLNDQFSDSYEPDESFIGDVVPRAQPVIPDHFSLKEAKEKIIESFERDYLNQLLVKHQYNISAVSRDAGIDRRHVYRLMKKYQIESP